MHWRADDFGGWVADPPSDAQKQFFATLISTTDERYLPHLTELARIPGPYTFVDRWGSDVIPATGHQHCTQVGCFGGDELGCFGEITVDELHHSIAVRTDDGGPAVWQGEDAGFGHCATTAVIPAFVHGTPAADRVLRRQ